MQPENTINPTIPTGNNNAVSGSDNGEIIQDPSVGTPGQGHTLQQFNQYNTYPQEVKVVERIIERDKPRRGFPNPLKPIFALFDMFGRIKQLIMFGCLAIIILFVLLVFTLIVRPPVLWNPLKDFLNAGVAPVSTENLTSDEVFNTINTQSESDLFVTISEAEFTTLIKDKLAAKQMIGVDLEENKMRMLINIDTDDNPLWLVADIEDKSSTLAVTKVGFGRFDLPGGINSFLSDQLFNILSLTKTQVAGNSSLQFFGLLVDLQRINSEVVVKNIYFHKDELMIQLEANINQGF